MENLLIPTNSNAPLTFPIRFDNVSEIHPKPTKKTVSFTRKRMDPMITDAHLNYLCRNGRLHEAVEALDYVYRRGSKVEPGTIINLLQSCIDSGSIHLGRILHARIVEQVTKVDTFVETKLVSMYAKLGFVEDARKVFESMQVRNLYTWSAMIGACSREQRWREVVELFGCMMRDGVFPDDFLFPKVLQGCGNCGQIETGRKIHALVIKAGMVSCARVSNSILAVYAKCGALDSAVKLFWNMEERDVVAWNSLLLGYCQKGENEEALRLVDEMGKEGIVPGLVTWNILIAGYNQRGQCDAAIKLTKKMESLGFTADVFTWTAMISGFAQNGRRSQALDFFREMVLAGVKPNGVTLASLLSACASLKALNLGLEVHSIAVKMGSTDDALLVGNSLIDMYSKCGELEAARRVFDLMEEKDVYTWNSMITGYWQAGFCGKACELFKRMQDSNVEPNVITWNAMISGYIQNGDEDEAMDLFQKMGTDGKVKQNTASWNLIIAGYLQNGKKEKALGVFRQMQLLSFRPNSVTILSVLPGCANLLASKKVKEIHSCVLRRNLDSVLAVINTLIDTYAKSGNIEYSKSIFEGTETRDIITWNSMIGGYVLHGFYMPALDIFDQMKIQGFKPNRGTLASIILAHSFAGSVEEGKQIFSSITDEHQILPALEHCLAMIDLYGRSGRLVEAMKFINDMNIQSEPLVWAALLTACRIYGNIGLALLAGEHMRDLEPANTMNQHLVSQIYALCGKHEGTSKVRNSGKDNMLKKSRGQSLVEVRNSVYSFFTGDQSEICAEVLYPWLESVCGKDSESDDNTALLIEEEEPEETGGVHSEKIGLAFALVSSSPAPQIVRIMKNLRICRHCHRTAKYLSKTYGCDIYLHDTKCLHHFKDGQCSCGDYW